MDRTAAPMTAQGPRKGEPSRASMRYGLLPQPARLVRGSSRRIMAMRFRPANIRVINRRVCSSAVIGPAVRNAKTRLKAHQQERVPATPPVADLLIAVTVLAAKGSLRRAKIGRALDRSAPLRRERNRDGRLRREHFATLPKSKNAGPPQKPRGTGGYFKTHQTRWGLDRVAPYQK